MKKFIFFIIILFFLIVIKLQASWIGIETISPRKKMFWSCDIGITMPTTQQYILGIYYYNKRAKFNPLIGFNYVGFDLNKTGRYEDYTSVFGTVNIFDDREDGDVYIDKWDGYGIASRVRIAKDEIIIGYSFCLFERSIFQSLYDHLEILGNNGYYYIDSPKPQEKETNFWYQIKYNVILSRYFSLGIGFLSNPILYYKNRQLKIDIGFTFVN
ncbi:MAG: hypothetical protein H8E33_00005 [Candidatus Cloacimonetes bacterium]|nr:hypothetical protein [Candidatus Cloacimonadota bacterium]